MINLSSHIEYLLLRHDCVVVPGLGALLVHEVHARFDADSCTFMPPSRSLGFNPAVTHNDG
ncbi:MAG: SPOR domain-containing protein, partial [Duncaniella sp.]|nr:SPOR domain-containing protein [Duncaniella sp.]